MDKEKFLQKVIKIGARFSGTTGAYLADQINNAWKSGDGIIPIRILDIGAGPGVVWETAGLWLKDAKFSLTVLDKIPSVKFLGSDLPGCASTVSISGDLRTQLAKIGSGEFDVVCAFDVIEHLSKSEGYLLIYEMMRISKSVSLINTPNGFLLQPPDTANPFMAHVSGWSYKEFRQMGFNVRVHHGLRLLTRPYMRKLYKITIFSAPIYFAESLIVKLLPNLAASLFVVIKKSKYDFDGLRKREMGLSPVKSAEHDN